MKQSFIFFITFILSPFVHGNAQEGGGDGGVKFEIFHVDLVPATFLYGGAELAFTTMMKNTMDNTIKAQMITDSMFMKLVILEEKTQAYQRELQYHLLRSLNENYISNRIKLIDDNQKWMEEYLVMYPQYQEVIDDCKTYVQDRAHNIKKFIDNATKKTGNEGRLDNVQRNDLNLYVIEELKRLCFISQSLKRELASANPDMPKISFPIPD
jgi:hypothetical protein